MLKNIYKRIDSLSFISFDCCCSLMEGCLVGAVRSLRHLPLSEVSAVLRYESIKLEVTKSLLSILYNICLVKSIVLSRRLKDEFRKHTTVVHQLLEGASRGINRTSGLAGKKKILIKTPELVKLLAEACPSVQRSHAVLSS